MTFHRLTVPTYFGGLPGGADYINNAISGTPAFANGALVAGPNSGSYFVGFAEDATSADVNRPAKALAENTDFLDDLLHRDIALPIRTADVGPTVGGTLSVLLTGPGIFLGLGGAQLKDLFHVMDADDDDFYEPTAGVSVIVTSITGGTVGTGFSAGNITINFNINIPPGSTFHIYYGQRSNFATFPADGLTMVRIRSAAEVNEQVEKALLDLRGTFDPWNSAWPATIFDLDARLTTATTNIAALGAAEAETNLRANNMQVLNWPYQNDFKSGGLYGPLASIAYDGAFADRWMAGVATSGALVVWTSLDGFVWTQLTAPLIGGSVPSQHPLTICSGLTTATQVLVAYNNVAFTFNGAAWVVQSTPASAGTRFTASTWFPGGNKFVVAGGDSTNGWLISSPDAVTWTDRSAQIPAQVTSWRFWELCVGGVSNSIILAIPKGLVYSTFILQKYMRSTDGATWTNQTFPGTNLTAGDVFGGIAWSAAAGLFMLTTYGLVGGVMKTKIFTSPDGITWTFVRLMNTVAGGISSLSAVGGTWVGVAEVSGFRIIYYSLDAGVTWAFVPQSFPADSSSNKDLLVSIASPYQFIVGNSTYLMGSLLAGEPVTF